MDIDLEKMPDHELIQLNRQIVAIMEARRRAKTYRKLATFDVGDEVEFSDSMGTTIKGVIVRVNKKTLSIDSYSPHGHWRVSPHLVRKSIDKNSYGINDSNVLDLFREQ